MNIIFERPTLNRTTDKENIALIDKWIADTVDKLNLDPDIGNSEDVPTKLSELEDDSTHRTVTDTEKASWNNKPSSANTYQTTDATETTIDDADSVPFLSSSGKRKITLTNIKAKLKTYFDTVYAAISHTHTKSQITDFPTLGTAASKDVPVSGNASTSQVVMGDDTRLTDSRTPTSHTHTKSEITDFPTFATVATSGSYDDLVDEPGVEAATSGGTTRSLVTTGEKYKWNQGCKLYPVWQVETTAATVRIPPTGYTDDRITTSSRVIVFASTNNGKPRKYSQINVYNGYVQVVLPAFTTETVTYQLYLVKEP